MIKVLLEVHEGAAPFTVAVEAEGITQAVSLIEGRHPGRDVRVVFPIDPEEFFVGDQEARGRGEGDRSETLYEPVMRV